MNKHSLFIKKIKKQFLSINSLLETYFNKLNLLKSKFKKGEIIRNNKVLFAILAVTILTLSYFSIPAAYNKAIIKSKIENQVFKKYNINIKLNEKIKYGLIPRPHFSAKNLSIIKDKKVIGASDDFKIFIDIRNFFSINQIETKSIIFKKVNFNIKFDELNFFKELLKTEPNENQIFINQSTIFFKSDNEETLFINKIFNSKFFYDSFNLQNKLESKNEIFNVPYKLIIKNDKFNKNLFTKINFKKIRLDIENTINYEDSDVKKGFIDILLINNNTSFDYQFNKNSLNFSSDDKNFFNGTLYFKPFYLDTSLYYKSLNTKNLFKNNSIIIDLFRSELLNNNNLNIDIDLKIDDITNIDELNFLSLKFSLNQGNINILNSKIMWKDDLEILMSEGLIDYNNNEILLTGKIMINAKNINDFYKSFQIKKKYRKDINKIEFDFVYNFNKNKLSFDNMLIDNKLNQTLDKFIDNQNSSEKILSNKILFKNFINNFFQIYAG